MKDKILLRVPERLKKMLEEQAEEKGMTLNGYLLMYLWDIVPDEREVAE